MNVLILDRAVGNGYSLGLAAGLRATGVNVVLGAAAASGADRAYPVYPRAGVAGRRLRKSLDLVSGVVRLLAIVLRLKPDVVHVQWPTSLDLAYLRLVRVFSRASIVYTAHNPVPRLGEDLGRQNTLFELARDVVVHSDFLAESLRSSQPQMQADIHVVPHGNYEHMVERFERESARDELGLDRSTPVFAFIGQIRPYKGVETLLEAFALHVARGRPGQLVVAGMVSDPRYFASLEGRSAQLGIKTVWHTSPDALAQRTLDLVASAATQIVLPFHEATQSGSMIFGFTHGRCVVTTEVGSLPETMGDRGILVPPRNPELLAGALSLAVDDPRECDRLGAAARDFALEHFSWARIGEMTLAVYVRATARPERAAVSLSEATK